MGFALALTNPTHFSLLSRFSLQTEKQGALWGWADGRDKIATGLAVFVGGVIVSAWSFEALFIVMGILQLCATVYIAALFKSEHLL
jgi:predicted MFS family arabinose efflux permease